MKKSPSEEDIPAVRGFLNEQAAKLASFLDFEPLTTDPERTAVMLDQWFDATVWRQTGHQLVHLGKDGTGSWFLAWLRPGANAGVAPDELPVVFLGSEGLRGVLSPSPIAFAQVLAYGPGVESGGGAVNLQLGASPALKPSGGPERRGPVQSALAAYRAAVEKRFGPLPSFDTCTSVPETLRKDFMAWTADCSPHLAP